jgi:hypothetical protein
MNDTHAQLLQQIVDLLSGKPAAAPQDCFSIAKSEDSGGKKVRYVSIKASDDNLHIFEEKVGENDYQHIPNVNRFTGRINSVNIGLQEFKGKSYEKLRLTFAVDVGDSEIVSMQTGLSTQTAKCLLGILHVATSEQIARPIIFDFNIKEYEGTTLVFCNGMSFDGQALAFKYNGSTDFDPIIKKVQAKVKAVTNQECYDQRDGSKASTQFTGGFDEYSISNLLDISDGEEVMFSGTITNARIITKDRGEMAFLSIEDQGHSIDAALFYDAYDAMIDQGLSAEPGNQFVFEGKMATRNDKYKGAYRQVIISGVSSGGGVPSNDTNDLVPDLDSIPF